MANLIFNPEDGWFVTPNLDGGDNGIVAFQLKFLEKGATVIVETCIDKTLGWDEVDTKVVRDKSGKHGDIINGVLEGLNVRVRTNFMPTKAVMATL